MCVCAHLLKAEHSGKLRVGHTKQLRCHRVQHEDARGGQQAADAAAQAAVAFGYVLQGTEWYVEALRRRVALAGGTAAQRDATRRYGLLHLATVSQLVSIRRPLVCCTLAR